MKTLPKLFICLGLSLIIQGAATPAFAQNFKWWQTERFQKELGLTPEQITRIEGVYQATEPLLRAQKQAVDRREEKVSKIIQDPKSDEPMLLQAMDRLEAARSEVSRTRTLMLYRIRRVLTEEQNAKMKAMHDRDRAERERKGRSQDENHANHSDCQ